MSRSADEYRRWLEAAEFSVGDGYGKGFPVLRSFGLSIMRRFIVTAIRLLTERDDYIISYPSCRVRAARYSSEVKAFGGYAETLELMFPHGTYVLRPDSAVDNLRQLLLIQAWQKPTTIVSCIQGFRGVRGRTIPHFRDRAIWPFLQMNKIVSANKCDEQLELLFGSFVRLFDTIGLPVRVVSMGPWKNYARRLYNIVAHLPDGSPTIVGMIFLVGDEYRKRAGVPETVEALDAGLTGKAVSVLIMQQIDGQGIALPSSISPCEVLLDHDVFDKNRDYYMNLLNGIRYDVKPRKSETWSKAGVQGIPLRIQQGSRAVRVFSRCLGWQDLSPQDSLRELLRRHDQKLRLSAVSHQVKVAVPPLQQTRQTHGNPIVACSPTMKSTVPGLATVFPIDATQFY